jgi:hypothetical protein
MYINKNMGKKIVMGFPHSYCRAKGQVAPTTHKGHDCVIVSQYDHAMVSQYFCAPQPINIYLFCTYYLTAYPMAIG